MSITDQFVRELNRPNPLPERLALVIANAAYPTMEQSHYLQQIDRLAQRMTERVEPSRLRGSQLAQRFLQVLNEELGFAGNRDNYYDPDNSCLNVVLERRTGLPIMLCLICVAIGRRLGLDIAGIGFPGHFMARLHDPTGDWLLDPFNAELLSIEDAPAHLARIFGQPVQLAKDAFAPVTPAAWAQRILFNLRNAYLGREDAEMTVRVLDLLLIMLPQHPVLWRERGLLHYQLAASEAAIADLRRSFFVLGQHALVWGNDEEKQAVQAKLDPEERRVVELYERLLQQRGRNN